jgi:hypothetical protein
MGMERTGKLSKNVRAEKTADMNQTTQLRAKSILLAILHLKYKSIIIIDG